jgi:purine catabolism regulator
VSLTIRQLVDIPSLRTRFLAGAAGADRPVLWAHTCELPDPWNWLGTGELLMSDGYGFPPDPDGQVRFISHLAQANLSGVALAEGLHAPPVTEEAVATADALAFPVLETAYAVPFVTVARTVADSNSEVASGRLIRILRVYDVLRRSNQAGFRDDSLLDALGRECGAELHVVDTKHARPLLPSGSRLGGEVRRSLLATLGGMAGPFPAFVRVPAQDRSVLGLPVDTTGRALMLAVPTTEPDVDLVVLQHVATIAGLDLERRSAAALRRRENAARFFQQLLDSAVDTDTAADRLAAAGLGERPWHVLSWGAESALDAEDVQLRLTGLKVPHLLTRIGDDHMAFVPGRLLDRDVFGYAEEKDVRVGVSQPIVSIGRVADGAREARWALETARSNGRTVVFYGEESPMFLPRTVGEGEAVVASVLGPLIAYDEANESELTRSLEVYFEAGRSWQEGASRLGIHKQTLVYRIRRIEELTGRRLADMDDQTSLYLALRTWKMIRGR